MQPSIAEDGSVGQLRPPEAHPPTDVDGLQRASASGRADCARGHPEQGSSGARVHQFVDLGAAGPRLKLGDPRLEHAHQRGQLGEGG